MDKISFKEVSLLVSIIAGFIFIVAFSSFYVQSTIQCVHACSCTEFFPIILIILSSLGVFVGAIVYFILIDKIIKKYALKKDFFNAVEPFLNLLLPEEKKVFMELLKKKEINQAEIVKKTGLTRVQCTRIIQKFSEKGFFNKTKKGKTNIISLKKELIKLNE